MSNLELTQTLPSAARRRLLKALASMTALAPGLSLASSAAVGKRLILIELAGGNDGLNTVIPFTQKRYYEARPGIAIARDSVVPLDEHLGLHPNLAPLLPAWKNGELHVALGVGYPDPNRSHFRSSDIWHTASGSHEKLKTGWLANGFDARRSAQFSAEGIAFGSSYGPFLGSTQSLVLESPVTFAKQARSMRPAEAQPDNVALNHIVGVRQQILRALEDINEVVQSQEKARVKGSKLHKQLKVITDMIASKARVPVFKATLTGFDTHFYQPNRHNNLMQDLGAELSGLRERLMASGHWNSTLIMTYSEFGRRAAENGSRGTDHGTAAPVLLMGGGVRGGFTSRQPAFPANVEQDLEFNLDYRRIYRTVAERWLGADEAVASLSEFKPLDLFSGP